MGFPERALDLIVKGTNGKLRAVLKDLVSDFKSPTSWLSGDFSDDFISFSRKHFQEVLLSQRVRQIVMLTVSSLPLVK